MPVFKRYKGKRIKSSDQNWKEANWCCEFRIKKRRVFKSLPEARTKEEAVGAEDAIRAAIYSRRYWGGPDIGFSKFFDDIYLPWSEAHNPGSYRDAKSRGIKLKTFFKQQPLRDIETTDCERFKSSLIGKTTARKQWRAGATMNRYMSLASGVFSRALKRGNIDRNPCRAIDREDEGGGRKRYLLPLEQQKLSAVLDGDLAFLRIPFEVSLMTGMRKRCELMRLKVEHINFGDSSMFLRVLGGDIELFPNCLLVLKGKNGEPRIIPMNKIVRTFLAQATQEQPSDAFVFSASQNNVTEYSLRWGFTEACKLAGVRYGEFTPGGIIWHDLRRTFATRLLEKGVHGYYIQDLRAISEPAPVLRGFMLALRLRRYRKLSIS